MGAATETKPLTSGFCTPGNPRTASYDPHARCPGHLATGGGLLRACSCSCHVGVDEVVDAEVLSTETGVLVTDAAPDTPDWFTARREGITGTDLPKILGLTKYGNALSVWLTKRDELDDTAGEAARWGQILEDPVAQEWATRHSTEVQRVGVLRHSSEAWIRASLDRIVLDCPDGDAGEQGCGLEVKTRSAFKAADWADGIPDDTLAQVAWGRRTTGLHHLHVAALIGGQRLETFRYDRDDRLETYLVDAARPVWTAVGEGVPPEVHPDSEGVLLELLDRLYTDRAGSRDLDPETARRWLDQYADGGALERKAKALKIEAKTALVQMLDDGDTGLVDEVPAFTYKAPAPGWALSADERRRLAAEQPDTWQSLIDAGFITQTTPAPRFDVKKRAKTEGAAA